MHRPARSYLITALLVAAGVLAAPAAFAQGEEEAEQIPWIKGPQVVDLGKQAEVKLPEGHLFADGPTTQRLLESMGNVPNGNETGLIVSDREDESWMLVFQYDDVGYVKDDEKNKIDADALLKSISEATEAANDYRKENGFGELHVVGWYEKPSYSEGTHNLTWAIEARDENDERSVNYNVRLLGRSGVTSVTLVTEPQKLAADKPKAETLVGGFSYKSGKKYAEFRPGDKVAAYGLTALVAGGAGAAAAKLGLLGKLGAMLGKAWKAIVLFLIAVAGAMRKFIGSLFGRKPAISNDASDVR